MNFSEFLLDETIKLYAKNSTDIDKPLNYTRIAKIVDSSQPVVWRQIHRGGKISAESFFRLVAALGNLKVDKHRKTMTIKLTDMPESLDIAHRFSKCHFKRDYQQ